MEDEEDDFKLVDDRVTVLEQYLSVESDKFPREPVMVRDGSLTDQ